MTTHTNIHSDFLKQLHQEQQEKRAIQNLLSRAQTPAAREAINTAVYVADLIIFHARVKRNGEKMMRALDDE